MGFEILDVNILVLRLYGFGVLGSISWFSLFLFLSIKFFRFGVFAFFSFEFGFRVFWF